MMKRTRYARSRQKSCQQCSEAKARCDRKHGGCTRCKQRDLNCTYTLATSPTAPNPKPTAIGDAEQYYSSPISNSLPTYSSPRSEVASRLPFPDSSYRQSWDIAQAINYGSSVSNTWLNTSRTDSSQTEALPSSARESDRDQVLDFTDLELVCPIDATEISNRWLNSYLPSPGQAIKNYPSNVALFFTRILKSYVTAVVGGRSIPPFLHATQTRSASTSIPLATCLSFVRICEKALPGADLAAADVLQREMNKLYDDHSGYDNTTLLAAFQAYLIYAMVLFFQLKQRSSPFLREAMLRLQELACATSKQGLMCSAEQRNIRPKWESWIVAETKRRTLYVMYLFDSVLSSQDGLPTFSATELQGLPAPSTKPLWQAKGRLEWERLYNSHLSEWADGLLCIDELWPVPIHMNAADLAARRDRVDHWAENLDEFGTMLFAVTTCTHGG